MESLQEKALRKFILSTDKNDDAILKHMLQYATDYNRLSEETIGLIIRYYNKELINILPEEFIARLMRRLSEKTLGLIYCCCNYEIIKLLPNGFMDRIECAWKELSDEIDRRADYSGSDFECSDSDSDYDY